MWDKYSAYKSEDWVVAVATTIDDNEVDGNSDKWNGLVINVSCINVIGLYMSTLLPEIGHFREVSRAEGPKQAVSRRKLDIFAKPAALKDQSKLHRAWSLDIFAQNQKKVPKIRRKARPANTNVDHVWDAAENFFL